MLTASLTAEPTADGVELELTVVNEGDEPVTLSFQDAQRAEFVATEEGAERWRWSDDRMFGMVTGSETLPPGDRVSYTATWPDAPSGAYEVRAWVAAPDADATAETAVTVS
ncbi:BsuPI-related putative proteinase inhibitor [Halobacterium zhouii]|uniref:BsuPI-related putative proteinase inhibitor n=1 Tax=Halobacterium zhouii TaxID=2902624 RepID=UPI001E37F2DA|nr:BsuPI-related putative proteinase inhibitor [Halobacterium zhouii]